MSSSSLPKIKQINVEIKPPLGATFYGTTPGGKPIYRETIVRAGPAEPVPDPDRTNPDGTHPQLWMKHPTTGHALYPMWRKRPVTITRLIVPNQEGTAISPGMSTLRRRPSRSRPSSGRRMSRR